MNRAFKDVVRWRSTMAHLQSSPKTASASEIRKTFLDYFCQDNGHLYIRSSPVFSLKDPTLAFTNAGMNQFKQVFLGIVQPASNRVANCQKCIRIGGMHNDLDQVGENGRHHTFFEMLGNWSFGDYFKEESCRMSWELLTKVYNLPPERLYVTYFNGDQTLGLDPDFDVREIWRKIGVKENHILGFGAKENFWTGSITGPCGPCTEIHYDLSSGRSDSASFVNSGTCAVTELWNLVFTQYDRKPDGKLTKLNTHFVDTGMGFERLVAVLQGKISNYDTDLFLPLFEVIKKHTGHSGYTGDYSGNTMDTSYRVLADHSRMIAVALSDGMIPNHQSKVRSIIRRSLTIVEKTFNAKVDLLKELTTHVAESLSDVYPEVEQNLAKIHYILEEEAELVKYKQEKALDRWENIKKSYPTLPNLNVEAISQVVTGWDYICKNILNQGKKAFSNEDIFVLFETYGVPIRTTKLIASKLGLSFDVVAYKKYEKLQKETVKKTVHEKFLQSFLEYPYFDILNKLEEKNIQSTCDYFKHEYRVDNTGKYIFNEQPTTIEAILLDNTLVNEITPEDIQDGKEIGIVLDRTQLFAEEGGQASDSGILEIENDVIFNIEKLVKIKNFVIHFGHFEKFPSNSKVTVQSLGTIKINENKRKSIMQNHTALHLVNAALREELYVTGEKFSKVTPEKLSLHFMVYRKFLNEVEGVKKIEKYVKEFILHGVSVNRKIFNHEKFYTLNNVVFIPGETILEHEIPVIQINSGFKLSSEYCTGTHVLNTADLQDFIITRYTRGSFNVHKIEAVTGDKCSQLRKADSELKEKWSDLQKSISECVSPHPSEVEDLLEKMKQLSIELSSGSREMSHFTRLEIKTGLLEAKKNLNNLFKTSLRDEISKASEATTENFVIHLLDYPWDFNPEEVESIASVCNKPILILFRRQGFIIIQCIVPEVLVSEKFSARKWLSNSVLPLSGVASCRKHQNPNLIFFTTELKCTEAQLQQVMSIAVEFAKNNI